MARGSLEECRYYLILTRDLEYGDVSETSQLLEEVSKLPEAYSRSILNSDSFHEKACQEANDVAVAGFRSRGMSCFHSHSIMGHYLQPGAWLGPPWGCNLTIALEVQGVARSHPDGTSSRYLFPVFARLSLISSPL